MHERPARKWHIRQRGFTLIELIMVIVILGVLAVFAGPRMFNTGDFSARGFHDETLSLLRFAQKTAVAQRRVVCVKVADTGLTLTMDTASTPTGNCNGTLALPNKPKGGTGLTASVAGAAITAFQFGSLGTSNQTQAITLTIANSSPATITVEADTGYVHD